MTKTLLTVFGFFVVTFGVQGLSHFVINKAHFDAISFARAEPILPMGFAAIIIQALIFSFVMTRLFPDGASFGQAVTVVACFGLFLASYIVLAEPAKYAAPSVWAWVRVEATASTLQFASFGMVLWLIYRAKSG